MAYEVIVKPSAAKAIRILDRTAQRWIVRVLGRLGEHPRPRGVAKMEGDDNLWRVPVGPGARRRAGPSPSPASLAVCGPLPASNRN